MTQKLTENIHHVSKLRDKERVFRDREHAGGILADVLAEFADTEALVLGIPSGGVPVATVVADELNLDLDVAVVSKITLPWNTEAGYGAVAFDGTVKLNDPMVRRAGLSDETVEEGIQSTSEKVNRRVNKMRSGRPAPDIEGQTVILVDDGIASGFTMRVAVEALKNQEADRIIVGTPTGEHESVLQVAEEVDEIYCLNIRSRPFAVAAAYENWRDVPEKEAKRYLDPHLEQ